MINISELESAGFVVIPNYLTESELSECQNDYANVLSETTDFVNQNYKFLVTNNQHLHEKIKNTLEEICKATSLTVDVVSPAASYYDTNLISFSWHQDYDPHYFQQESYHALNFWIPLIKPDPKESGLSVIPFNKLPSNMQEGLIGQGAKQFTCGNNSTTVIDYDSGRKWSIGVNIDDIAESPILYPGDLLLMRQDIIHRSQAGNNHRVALGIRCYNGEASLSRSKFFGGCFKKKNIIKNNREIFKYVEQKFEQDSADIKLKSVIAEMSKK